MTEQLNGLRKSAILLLSLDERQAQEILSRLPGDSVQRLEREIDSLRDISAHEREAVFQEFRDHLNRPLLEDSPMDRDAPPPRWTDNWPAEVDANSLIEALRDEHPQAAAVVLAHVTPHLAAEVLSAFGPASQMEIVKRLTAMAPAKASAVRELFDALSERVRPSATSTRPSIAPSAEQQMLQHVLDRADEPVDEREPFDDAPPAEATLLRLAFEDLAILADRDLRVVLDEVDGESLLVALQTASERLRRKMLRNVTASSPNELRANMQMLGPIHLGDVEAAQRRVLRVVQRLEAAGDITISPGDESRGG